MCNSSFYILPNFVPFKMSDSQQRSAEDLFDCSASFLIFSTRSAGTDTVVLPWWYSKTYPYITGLQNCHQLPYPSLSPVADKTAANKTKTTLKKDLIVGFSALTEADVKVHRPAQCWFSHKFVKSLARFISSILTIHCFRVSGLQYSFFNSKYFQKLIIMYSLNCFSFNIFQFFKYDPVFLFCWN